MYTSEGCQKDAGHAQGAMDQRPIHAVHAEHSLGIRCVFIGWDIANTHGGIELSPYLWCNWWQACQLQVFFKQRFHILGLTTVTTTKVLLCCLHGTHRCWLQAYLGRHRWYGISMKRSDLQCFWAKECVKNGNLGFPNANFFLKLSKDN